MQVVPRARTLGTTSPIYPSAGGNLNFDVSSSSIEDLLEHFVSAALGLTLESRILRPAELPSSHRSYSRDPSNRLQVWMAWHTNKGPVCACALYDLAQAQRMAAHVLKIDWWIARHEHHEGWWHCYRKRPRDGLRVSVYRIVDSYRSETQSRDAGCRSGRVIGKFST